MDENFEDRLAAVERALTDGDHTLSALAGDAETADRLDTLEADIEELSDRVAELEAATQALRGYVGNVRAVNEEVEERADLAISKAERAHDAAVDDRKEGADSQNPPSASTGNSLQSSIDGRGANFETPRTDELRDDPDALAGPPDHSVGGDSGPSADSQPEMSGLVARIRALL